VILAKKIGQQIIRLCRFCEHCWNS